MNPRMNQIWNTEIAKPWKFLVSQHWFLLNLSFSFYFLLLLLIYRKQSLLGKSNLLLFTAFHPRTDRNLLNSFFFLRRTKALISYMGMKERKPVVNACFLVEIEIPRTQWGSQRWLRRWWRLVSRSTSSPTGSRIPSRLHEGAEKNARLSGFGTMLASINTSYRAIPSKCNLNAYFSEELHGEGEQRKMSFSCIFLNASNILNTSSDNHSQFEKLLKSLIKKETGKCFSPINVLNSWWLRHLFQKILLKFFFFYSFWQWSTALAITAVSRQ